ncbi:MAG: cytochrome c [Myxococcales bacterium]|jgi:mono/diheme cytochrome c family protein
MRLNLTGIFLVGCCLAAFGCTSKETAPAEQKAEPAAAEPAAAEPEKTEVAAMDPAAEAQQIFQSRCTVCHGQNGKGDGPGAAALNPKPRDYTNEEWQKSVTDEHLHETIVKGGLAMGLSAGMPPNPDLADKPEVVDELVKIVRGFAGK